MKESTQSGFKENEIKDMDTQLPSSRREIEEDMLEQICLIANAGAEITVKELCSRMDMTRREVNFYLKQMSAHGYIAREFDRFSENIWLHITEDESSFELMKKENESLSQNLWYKDPEKGWIQAEEKMENPWIPSSVFKFSTRCQNPIIEGTALIAFTRKGEKPVDWNSRELDVHIWKSEG